MLTDSQFETDNGTTRHDYAPTSFYRAGNPLLGSQLTSDMACFVVCGHRSDSKLKGIKSIKLHSWKYK